MNKFKNRIKYYLVGFLMGAIAVAFFFGQRGCTWLPGNRVKSVIAENNIVIGDSIFALLNCLADDSQPIYDILNTTGDVNFSESKTHQEDKVYLIEGEDELKVYFKIFENDNFESYSEIINIESPKINCSTDLSNRNKQPLILPKKLVFQIIESHSFTYYPIINCQLECYNIPEDSLKTLHKKAIRFSTSDQPDLINKIYNISLIYNQTRYLVTYEIGENRTRIKNIKLLDLKGDDLCQCE